MRDGWSMTGWLMAAALMLCASGCASGPPPVSMAAGGADRALACEQLRPLLAAVAWEPEDMDHASDRLVLSLARVDELQERCGETD